MNKNELDLAELQLHLEALRLHSEKNLPPDIREKLNNEMEVIVKKLMEVENGKY